MESKTFICDNCHLNEGGQLSPNCCGGINYINHSGGAKGSDSVWDTIGRRYGVQAHRHYWHNGLPKPPLGNVELSNQQLEEGWLKVLKANKKLKRRPEKYKSLLARNWFQVKNTEGVYAIGTLVQSWGAGQVPDEVSGGTGWAVQMAIDCSKPVFVFDQELKSWFRWNNLCFVGCNQPKLSQNFTGIGTRNINEDGKDAIEKLYRSLIIKTDYND